MPLPPSKRASKKPKRSYSKSSAQYWRSQVYLDSKSGWESSTYYVRIQVKGKRRTVVLKASTKEAAASEALGIYLDALVNGWSTSTRKAAPKKSGDIPSSAESGPTIGEWKNWASSVSQVRHETINKYFEALCCVVGESLGLLHKRSRSSREQVAVFPLSSLSRDFFQQWIDLRIERLRKLDQVKQARGHNTIRALIRNTKSLFSETIRDAIEERFHVQVGNLFTKLRVPKGRHFPYSSRFNAERLLESAALSLGVPPDEMAGEEEESRYEQFKILYLALVAGLRYNEIDKLRVQDVCVDKGRISIQMHEEFQPKAPASVGDVMVGDAARAVIGEMLSRTDGYWFVSESRSDRAKRYRTGLHHDRLLKWLRAYEERGERPLATVQKPLHELRKEAGTIVNKTHGLNEAKNFLRHGSIVTTASFYIGTKGGITTGLG